MAQNNEQDILAQLLQMSNTAANPLLTLATTFGPPVLGAIGGLFQGKSDAEKRSEKVFNLAQNRMGQNVLDPQQYLADFMRANSARFNQEAEGINRRLNLDSGVAQGALAESRQGSIAQFFLNAKMQNDILKSQKDDMLLRIMAGLGG